MDGSLFLNAAGHLRRDVFSKIAKKKSFFLFLSGSCFRPLWQVVVKNKFETGFKVQVQNCKNVMLYFWLTTFSSSQTSSCVKKHHLVSKTLSCVRNIMCKTGQGTSIKL